ncbi:MAG: hypothetical protein QW467_03925, partial [Candidatus Caldarchaeum sp.]
QNISSIMEMKARGASILLFRDKAEAEPRSLADHYIRLPKTHPLLSPIIYTVPFQLLAYYLAVLKGYDPDKPRNLAKSVTVL